METDGDQAAIPATPFGFVAVNESVLAAGGEETRKVLRVAKDVGSEIEGLELVKRITGEKLEKSGIGGEE